MKPSQSKPDHDAGDAWARLRVHLFNDPTLMDDVADHLDAPGGEDQDTSDRVRAAFRYAIDLREREARRGF